MLTNKLLLSTRNPHKLRELEQILAGLNITILAPDQVGEFPDIEEDGETFAENAIKKASTLARLSNYITLADDSGLVVDALQGAPGVYSARFSGENATDEDNNRKLLELLQDVPEPERTARFICTIAVCSPSGQAVTVEGRCEGRIALVPRGQGGFGYDPLFIPAGYSQSFAELGATVKNQISHRGQALQKARGIMKDFFPEINGE